MRIWRKIGYVASYVFWYALAFICLYFGFVGTLMRIMLLLCVFDLLMISPLPSSLPANIAKSACPTALVSSAILLIYLIEGGTANPAEITGAIIFLCIYGIIASIANELLRLTFVTPRLDRREERQQQRHELTRQIVEARRPGSPHRAHPTDALKRRFAELLSDEDMAEAEAAAEAELEVRRQAR